MLLKLKKYRKTSIGRTKFLSNIRGSVTIEGAIITPILFLCVLFAIYLPVRFYKMTSMGTITNLTAQRGTATWDNIHKDIDIGKPMNMVSGYDGDYGENIFKDGRGEEISLYWRILDKQKDIKKHRLKIWGLQELDRIYAFDNLGMGRVQGERGRNIDVEVKNDILLKTIEVKASWGKDLSTGRSCIFGPAEIIRNIDYIIETGRRLKGACPNLEEYPTEKH